MAMFTVPPGGLAGFRQMTPASQRALFPSSRSPARSGRRKRRASSSKRVRAGARSSRKLKFGSPAWQKKYKVGKFAKRRR